MAKKATDIDDIIDEISSLMKDIEETKQQYSTKQGQVETLLENLKDEFGVDTYEDAQNLLKDLRNKRNKKMEKLVDEYEKLRSEYDW